MKKILLLLANGYETFEAAVFIDVIGWNLIDGDKSTKLFSCGLTKEVNSSFDQKCIVDYLIDDININDYDALAIPGGFEEFGFYKDAYDKKFLNLIIGFKKENKLIASICVAALPLGRSGVLEGKYATTYNKNEIRLNMLKEYGANVKNEPIVVDSNIITCWNPSVSIDVAFLLLEHLTTKKNTDYIRNIMGFDSNI
ncbi:MAG: DJ-1/PfpI family protein [Campylobacterales bacterium]|nr:DJ-1/PfpI family protein [Campylobacterales bacterium]